MRFPLLLLSAFLVAILPARAAAPVVSNVRVSQRVGTQLVDIYYNVSAATSTVKVSVQVSADDGASYNVPATTFTGAYGAGWRPMKGFSLTGAIENLTDEDYRIHGSGLNEAGRNFILAADWRF